MSSDIFANPSSRVCDLPVDKQEKQAMARRNFLKLRGSLVDVPVTEFLTTSRAAERFDSGHISTDDTHNKIS
ncbi:MAG: hypothetical protein OXI96_09115 [Acidimicrobiaceae bacterium]|nr:hypothetical protein [Acidimicrobiaceae bacterium]